MQNVQDYILTEEQKFRIRNALILEQQKIVSGAEKLLKVQGSPDTEDLHNQAVQCCIDALHGREAFTNVAEGYYDCPEGQVLLYLIELKPKEVAMMLVSLLDNQEELRWEWDDDNRPYETWKEALAAIKTLGITTWDEYRKRYFEDSKLPEYPSLYYMNFPGDGGLGE